VLPSLPAIEGNVDPFARINELTPQELDRLAEILEIRGNQPRQIKIRKTCFDAAGISAGMNVLEVGCGTGVVVRQLAELVGAKGRVVGLDPSVPLLDYARRFGTHSQALVEYIEGDAFALPFPDGLFDGTLAVTVLAHVTEPQYVVAEMCRVTKPGGIVMLFDQDYQTLVFEHSDKRLTRKILLHGADHNVIDGWCGRKLPGLLVEARLRGVKCWPFVYGERDSNSYLITIAERFAGLAVRQRAISPEEAKGWLDELYERDRRGTFYGSLNYYFAHGSL
jgi:ubiquinone/menaquinone biosynthesis C-methylase UbiE